MRRLKTRLFILSPATAFSGVVDSDPTSPFLTISWNNGTTGSNSSIATSGAPQSGNTVWFGTTPGGKERGKVRLRSWSPSGGNPATGQFVVGENADVTPFVSAGDYITIKQQFELWSKFPRDVIVGESTTTYQDYDIEYNNQTVNWYPVAVAGVPAVEKLSGGDAVVKFVGDRSFANAPGAGIASWSWVAHGSDEVTSTDEGTEMYPVTFTWHNEGMYLVSLTVTDTNGNSHTAHTWVFVYDESNPTVGYTRYDSHRELIDFTTGGGEADFTVYDTADASQFPDGALVVHAYDGAPEMAYANSWPFRENILFVGYLSDAEITQDAGSGNGVTFKATTIDGLMKNMTVFPASLTDVASPSGWQDASAITIDRFLDFLARWRSTLVDVAPMIPLRYTAEIYWHDSGYQTLYDAMDELAANGWAHVVVNQQGVVHTIRDYQLMTTGTERALGSTNIGTITSSDWLTPLSISYQADYNRSVARVRMDGVYYNGSTNVEDSQELLSEAPGIVPKSYGRMIRTSGLVLTTQDDLNKRCGLQLARENMEYPVIRANFLSDMRFGVAPQQAATLIINSDDNLRGLSWTATAIPRKVSRTYDHENGVVRVSVDFEPDSQGEPGVTITKPPTPTIPDETVTGTVDGIMTAASVHRWMNGESGWTQVHSGTTHWIDIRDGVVLRGGSGKIEKSVDYGTTWDDVSPLSSPPNTWGDSPAPTVADLAFYEVRPDYYESGTWWAAANWQNTSSAWRTWIAKSTGASFDWNWI